MANIAHHCHKFENGLRDEIKMPMSTNLHMEYSHCVESTRMVERFVPKLKPKEASIEVKVKFKCNASLKEQSQGN